MSIRAILGVEAFTDPANFRRDIPESDLRKVLAVGPCILVRRQLWNIRHQRAGEGVVTVWLQLNLNHVGTGNPATIDTNLNEGEVKHG